MDTKENIEKALHSASFLCDDLQAAIGENAVVDIVLIDTIEQAVKLKQKLQQLQGAIND